MSWVSDKLDEIKEDRKIKNEYNKQTKVKAREQYLMEKQEQELRIAKERAKIEADAKLKSIKAKYEHNKRSGSGAKGFALGLMGGFQAAGNQLMGDLVPQRQPVSNIRRPMKQRRKPQKRKKSKKRKHYQPKKTVAKNPYIWF